MESFKSRKNRSPKDLSRIQIGQPVLVDNPETQERINQLGCIDLSPQPSMQPIQDLQKQIREMELEGIVKRTGQQSKEQETSLDLSYSDHVGKFPKTVNGKQGRSYEDKSDDQRVSLYDNLSDVEVDLSVVDPQEELDRILQELYQNISGLDATLEMAGQEEVSIDCHETGAHIFNN
jgi:hypothetical protein